MSDKAKMNDTKRLLDADLDAAFSGPTISVPTGFMNLLVLALERQRYLLLYSDPANRIQDQSDIDRILELSKEFIP